eukprot:125830-Hanusia_phi.AAC.1
MPGQDADLQRRPSRREEVQTAIRKHLDIAPPQLRLERTEQLLLVFGPAVFRRVRLAQQEDRRCLGQLHPVLVCREVALEDGKLVQREGPPAANPVHLEQVGTQGTDLQPCLPVPRVLSVK